MSYHNELSLGEAIEAWLKSRGLKDKVLTERAITDWPRIMGKAIAENTENLWFREGIFYVKMRSPIWKNELIMAKSKIREMLNREMGKELINEVKIV